MIGRTNAGGGGGGKVTVTINAPKNSTVSWTGTESGSVNMGSVTQATATLKAGTYSFSCSLTLDGTATTIFTRTAAVTKGSVVNMYPDGAVFWYGMGVYADIEKADYGTFTADEYYRSSTYSRARSTSKLLMTKTAVAYDTTGKTSMHVMYKDGSASTVINTAFYAQEESPSGTASANGVYNTGASADIAECIVSLGALAGKSLYFCSAYNAFGTYSGSGKCAHDIYAVWFE